MRRRHPSPALVLLIAALLAVVAVSWFAWRRSSRGDPGSAAMAASESGTSRAPRRERTSRWPSWPPASGVRGREAAPDSCAPHAKQRCIGGDVYWVDSCGGAEDKATECGEALCRDGACAKRDPTACADLPLAGRCDGDVVRGCVGDRPYARDCRALGKRCVIGAEGAQCGQPPASECEPDRFVPRCQEQTLVRCTEGRIERIECAAHGAVCIDAAEPAVAACLQFEHLEQAPEPDDPCGPCGCEPTEGADEVCDGRDNDGDGAIDEGVACEAIPVLAFVVADAAGRSSYSVEDIERELERINRVLGGVEREHGLAAELVDVVELRQPDWLLLDDDDFQALAVSSGVLAARPEFYVPLVFTDEVESGQAPKAGVSTLPNGRCGGRRIDDGPQPMGGAIAVAKGRAPTTAAHEIGHFLGLCHTHYAYESAVLRIAQWRSETGELEHARCAPICREQGDGMCDTPPDPGPDDCAYDVACQVGCSEPEHPDPFNVMSYYTECRHTFSELQLLEMRRTLALRRAWHACRDAACACDPLVAGACPPEMSCAPTSEPIGWACRLAGALAEGAACSTHAQCASGMLCIGSPEAAEGACSRMCARDDEGCRCDRVADLEVGVCRP